jgi:hypothetical protein
MINMVLGGVDRRNVVAGWEIGPGGGAARTGAGMCNGRPERGEEVVGRQFVVRHGGALGTGSGSGAGVGGARCLAPSRAAEILNYRI